jgi:hypothetical protein
VGLENVADGTAWEEMVARRNAMSTLRQIERRIRREMWTDLGFIWSDGGLLGDICIGMVGLSQNDAKTFNDELKRRVDNELKK